MRSIPRYEQETVIRWAADEPRATISTANPAVIRKLDKLVAAAPADYEKVCALDDNHDARYTVSAGMIRFGKPMSKAQREALEKNRTKSNLTSWSPSASGNPQTSNAALDSFPYPTHDTAETRVHEEEKA